MKKKMILFDLDGTLLPMNEPVFVKAYFGALTKKLSPIGYDPEKLIQTMWDGTKAMVMNDGTQTNEEAFWKTFRSVFGEASMKHYPVFADFYDNDFPKLQSSCGCLPEANETVKACLERGYRVALATNPIFPSAATEERIRWAGIDKNVFDLITTYEDSHYCKPNPMYYQEVLKRLGVEAEDCMMIGNDGLEDGVITELGIPVFLIDGFLLHEEQLEKKQIKHGTFADALKWIEEKGE